MAADPTPPYSLSWSQDRLDQLRTLTDRAAAGGMLPERVATLRRIRGRLESDPRRYGDPLYSLPSLRLLVYRMVVDRVEVSYAVHDTRPLVFVRAVVPRSGHPLEGD